MASMVASMMTLRQSWRTVQEAAGMSTVSCLAEVVAAAVWQGQRRTSVQMVCYRLPSMFAPFSSVISKHLSSVESFWDGSHTCFE
jgi:hypothetical protein